jgi:hypothetical protein
MIRVNTLSLRLKEINMVAKKTPAKKTVATKTVAKKPVAAKKTVAKKPVEKKPVAAKKAPAKKAPVTKPKLTVKAKSAKELATKAGEPYVNILSVELDKDDIGNGAFELDWNDIFVAKLVRAGYQGKTDADIVDNWFKTICRNILTEEYEQWEANQPEEMRPRVIDRRDIGGGKTEVS